MTVNHKKREWASRSGVVAPDLDQELIVYVDVLHVGLGAVLCQADDRGNLHPVTLISRFQPGERHLSAIKKVCLLIAWTLQKLKPYTGEGSSSFAPTISLCCGYRL